MDINQGLFAIGAGGAKDPPRRNASYLGGKELEPLFAHCTHHYSFPLQKTLYMNDTNVYVRKISVLVRGGRKIREGSQLKFVFWRNYFCVAPPVKGLQKRP